jgi:integration host factor subunit alpha
MASLTKAQLVERLNSHGLGYTKEELHRYVVDFFSIIEEELCSNSDVSLSRFGFFEVVDKVARPGRNPRTKEEVIIARRKGVRFRPSPILTKQINEEENNA